VDTLELKKPAAKRRFKAWIEDWEEEARVNQDEVCMVRLCNKYGNLKFWDPDNKRMCRIHDEDMKFFKGNKRQKIDRGWSVVAVYGDGEEDAEPWQVGELLCQVIRDTPQDEGVEVVTKEDGV